MGIDVVIPEDWRVQHMEANQMYVLHLPCTPLQEELDIIVARFQRKFDELPEGQRPVLIVMSDDGYDLARVGDGEGD